MGRKFKREGHLTVVTGRTDPAPQAAPGPACPTCQRPLAGGVRCDGCRLWVGRAPGRFCPTRHGGRPTVDTDGGCVVCRDFPLVKLRYERRGAVGVWVEVDRRDSTPAVAEVQALLDATFGPGWREAADLTARVSRELVHRGPGRPREPGEEG